MGSVIRVASMLILAAMAAYAHLTIECAILFSAAGIMLEIDAFRNKQ